MLRAAIAMATTQADRSINTVGNWLRTADLPTYSELQE